MVIEPSTPFVTVANDLDDKLTQFDGRFANVGEQLHCLAVCKGADAQ